MIFNPFEAFLSKKKKESTPSQEKLSMDKFRNKAVLITFLLAQGFNVFAGTPKSSANEPMLPSQLDITLNESAKEQGALSDETINYNDYISFEPEAFTRANFEKSTEGFSIDVEQSFQTDKAEIGTDAQKQIIENAHKFFASITPERFDEIIDGEWELYGSSDERPTNAWGEKGNEGLTEARIDATATLLDNARNSFDFNESGLSDEQIERILNKEIKHTMPDGGVTHITDFVNPETGSNFTRAEIETLTKESPETIAYLLQQARMVEFRTNIALSENAEIVEAPQENQESSENEPTYEYKKMTTYEAIPELAQYESLVFGLDNSPSAKYDEMLAGISKYNDSTGQDFFDKLSSVHMYSDNMDKGSSVSNLSQLERFTMRNQDKGDHHERLITSAKQILENLETKTSGDHALVMWTDEIIQDGIEIGSLHAMAEEKGYDIIFAMTNDQSKEVALVSSETVLAAFHDNKEHLLMADGSGRPIAGKNFFVGIADVVYDMPTGHAHKVILKQLAGAELPNEDQEGPLLTQK